MLRILVNKAPNCNSISTRGNIRMKLLNFFITILYISEYAEYK